MEEAYNLSVAINNNLKNYDRKLRPNAGGKRWICIWIFNFELVHGTLLHLEYIQPCMHFSSCIFALLVKLSWFTNCWEYRQVFCKILTPHIIWIENKIYHLLNIRAGEPVMVQVEFKVISFGEIKEVNMVSCCWL